MHSRICSHYTAYIPAVTGAGGSLARLQAYICCECMCVSPCLCAAALPSRDPVPDPGVMAGLAVWLPCLVCDGSLSVILAR